MELDKLNKRIKSKLEKRNVAPKETTWNRLETLLEEEERKVKKYAFLKYAVAASIALFLGFFFSMNQETNSPLPQIVVDVPIENTKNTELNQNFIQTKIDVVLKKKGLIVEKGEPLVYQAVKKVKINKRENQKNDKRLNSMIDNVTVIKTVLLSERQEKKVVISGYSDKNKERVNVQLNDEVDDLLAIAFSEQKQQTKTVVIDENLEANANALLSNVEQELDASFKAKMFKKLKKGLKNTRTAVINRNK